MTRYLNARGIRIFDYPDFAKTLRERVRETAAALALEAGKYWPRSTASSLVSSRNI